MSRGWPLSGLPGAPEGPLMFGALGSLAPKSARPGASQSPHGRLTASQKRWRKTIMGDSKSGLYAAILLTSGKSVTLEARPDPNDNSVTILTLTEKANGEGTPGQTVTLFSTVSAAPNSR